VKHFDLGWTPPELNSNNVCVTDDFRMYLLGSADAKQEKDAHAGCMNTQTATVGHSAYFCRESLTGGMDTIIPLGVILKDSVVSFLWTARKLGLRPLILIHHRLKATPRGINSTALQAEGKLQQGDSYQWHMLEW